MAQGQQLEQTAVLAPGDSAIAAGNTQDSRSSLLFEALDTYQTSFKRTADANAPAAADAPASQPADATAKPTDATSQPTDAASEVDNSMRTIILGKGESYPGEFGINIDAKPTKLISKGETFEELAKNHLGPQASEQDIAKHAKEIRIINYMSDEPKSIEGKTLTLPGHTKDGAILYSDFRGTRITVNENNSMTFLNSDGTKHTLTGNPEGGYTKVYSGSKPEDNYTVKVNADGLVESNDRVDPNHRDAGSLDTEKARLTDVASKTILLTRENATFQKDMEQFETRARSSGLSEQEVAKTYNEISRILEAEGNKPLTDRERVRMALGIMRGAAEPTANDQGEYNTCQVTVIENKLYLNEPSTVARALADVATTGKFIAQDGSPVVLRPDDLRAHGQAGENSERGSWNRTYSSQVFQVTAINSFYARHNQLDVPPGELRFEQGKRVDNQNNGERLVDYATIPPKIGHTPGVMAYPNGMVETEYLMSGKWAPEATLSSRDYYAMTMSDSDKTGMVSGAKHLERRLQQLQEDGKFPLHVVVHVNSDSLFGTRKPEKVPFANKPNPNNYLGDVHVVNVIGYDQATGLVKIDNQWGNGGDFIDKPLTVDQLWNGMNRPKANTWLDRLEADRTEMQPEEFAGHLKAIMTAYVEHWQEEQEASQVKPDQTDIATSREHFNKLTESLDPKFGQPVKADVDRLFQSWEENKAQSQ